MTLKKENRTLSSVEGNLVDAPTYTKIGLRRKLLALISVHFIFMTLVASTLKFTPLARFYINENEWIFQLVCPSLVLVHILLTWKRNDYNTNVFLLFLHMLLQTMFVAVFVTSYDSLGVLQGIFLTFCALTLMLLHLLLFRKPCDLYVTLSASCFILFIAALVFQTVFGCPFEELCTAVALALGLTLYFAYSAHRVSSSVPVDKFCVATVHAYTWPIIASLEKMESFVKRS